jgi:DNA-binding MarR family transcriptional regulator
MLAAYSTRPMRAFPVRAGLPYAQLVPSLSQSVLIDRRRTTRQEVVGIRTRANPAVPGLHPPIPTRLEERCGLPFRTLMRVAQQGDLANPQGCATTLALLSASHAVRVNLHHVLKPLNLSEARFHTLVVLYSLDPSPSTSADLAYHAETTRTAMTDTLDQMEAKKWVRRKRVPIDRRVIHIHLTARGRAVAVSAIHCFLKAAGDLAGRLSGAQSRVFLSVCGRLQQQARATGA